MLDHNNVHLQEGGWAPSAYRDAIRHAWARSHAFKNKHLKSKPADFAIPEESRTLEYSESAFEINEPTPLPPQPTS